MHCSHKINMLTFKLICDLSGYPRTNIRGCPSFMSKSNHKFFPSSFASFAVVMVGK